MPPRAPTGDKDLEVFAQALGPGEVLFAVKVPTIHKKRALLTGSAFRLVELGLRGCLATGKGGPGRLAGEMVEKHKVVVQAMLQAVPGRLAHQAGFLSCPLDLAMTRPTAPLRVRFPLGCREAAHRGGAGGVWQAVLPGQGLFDAAQPWEQPAGSLTVRLRYPSCFLQEAVICTCLTPQPVHLLGCDRDVVGAALAAGSIAGMLAHRREAAEMAAEAAALGAPGCGLSGSPDGSPRSARSTSSSGLCGTDVGRSSRRRSASAFCLSVDLNGSCGAEGAAAVSGEGSSRLTCSPAAAAMLRALRSRVPGLQAWAASGGSLLDDQWAALQRADVIILDAPWPAEALPDGCADGVAAAQCGTGTTSGGGTSVQPERLEQLLAAATDQLAGSGLLELLWQRFWGGALLVGVGRACALLGRQACPSSAHSVPPVLPWYLLRAGGGSSGWASLQAALLAAAAAPTGAGAAAGQALVGAGVMATGCWLVHPTRGQAELLVVPCREALVATAAWAARAENDFSRRGLEEADSDWGFFCELANRQ